MLVVDLTRLSALVCQCHRVKPGRSRRRLKDQVADRNWEGLVTRGGSDDSGPEAVRGRQEQGHPLRALIVVRQGEPWWRNDVCLKGTQLGINDEVSIGLKAVDPDVGPDKLVTSAVFALHKYGVLEPGFVDRGELAELHALIWGLDPTP